MFLTVFLNEVTVFFEMRAKMRAPHFAKRGQSETLTLVFSMGSRSGKLLLYDVVVILEGKRELKDGWIWLAR